MGSDYDEEIKNISYDDILSYTGNLSAGNKIGNFEFGEVYRGKIREKEVTLKIWRNTRSRYINHFGDNAANFNEELILQTWGGVTSDCRVAKVIEYCDDEDENRLAVVYNLNPLGTLQNLIQKVMMTSLVFFFCKMTWLQRVKIAYQLADLLKFLHTAPLAKGKLPYMDHYLNPAHIMIGQDYSPILYDFSMFTGGILPDKSLLHHHFVPGYYGYAEPPSSWGRVFIAGDLIDKNGVDEKYYADARLHGVRSLFEWAAEEYGKRVAVCGKGNVSLVDQSFEDDQDFELADGPKITDVVMDCLVDDQSERPDIDKVIDLLDGLLVVQRNPDTFGIGTNRGRGLRSGDMMMTKTKNQITKSIKKHINF